jgi:hypothetical protein
MPNRLNVDSLVTATNPVDKAYLADLFWGFVYELEGALDSAEQRYQESLGQDVQGGLAYYARRDLARVALKSGRLSDAAHHLREYLRLLDLEIRFGEGDPAAGDSLGAEYVPSPAALLMLRDEHDQLTRVLADLRTITG